MRQLSLLLVILLLFGCSQQAPASTKDKPVSDDSEVAIIVGENYSVGEPIVFQLKTSNYSIVYMNRSGGYQVGSYPSVWICRQTNESCINVEYRQMRDFSKCSEGVVNIAVPVQSSDVQIIWPAEKYGMLLLWDQKDWREESSPCGKGASQSRNPTQVSPGKYSITFVYWVSWEKEPRSVSADFRIV